MGRYYRLLNYLYNVQEISLYSEEWCFVYTCFMDVIMIFISIPETFHFVYVMIFMFVCMLWVYSVYCKGYASDMFMVLLSFYYFDFVYLSWFVPNFWHSVMNFSYLEWLYSTLAQEIGYVLPVLVEKAHCSSNRKFLVDEKVCISSYIIISLIIRWHVGPLRVSCREVLPRLSDRQCHFLVIWGLITSYVSQ